MYILLGTFETCSSRLSHRNAIYSTSEKHWEGGGGVFYLGCWKKNNNNHYVACCIMQHWRESLHRCMCAVTMLQGGHSVMAPNMWTRRSSDVFFIALVQQRVGLLNAATQKCKGFFFFLFQIFSSKHRHYWNDVAMESKSDQMLYLSLFCILNLCEFVAQTSEAFTREQQTESLCMCYRLLSDCLWACLSPLDTMPVSLVMQRLYWVWRNTLQ